MAEKSNVIAIVALCISIGSAAFSLYQWWNSQTDSKINAAIEISKNYIQDRDQERPIHLLSLRLNPKNKFTSEQSEELSRYMARLEYYALLINNRRVDETFVAWVIVCDMSLVLAWSKLVKGDPPVQAMPETEKYIKKAATRPCAPLDPPQSN